MDSRVNHGWKQLRRATTSKRIKSPSLRMDGVQMVVHVCKDPTATISTIRLHMRKLVNVTFNVDQACARLAEQ